MRNHDDNKAYHEVYYFYDSPVIFVVLLVFILGIVSRWLYCFFTATPVGWLAPVQTSIIAFVFFVSTKYEIIVDRNGLYTTRSIFDIRGLHIPLGDIRSVEMTHIRTNWGTLHSRYSYDDKMTGFHVMKQGIVIKTRCAEVCVIESNTPQSLKDAIIRFQENSTS